MFESTLSINIESTGLYEVDENELLVHTISPVDADNLRIFDLPTPIHIICVGLITSLSLSGNSLVLYIYAKKKKPMNVGNIFILAMAILDIYASLAIPTQFAMMYTYVKNKIYHERENEWRQEMMLYFFFTVLLLYLELLVSMALDRVWAVFAPFSYTQSKKRILVMIAFEILFSISMAVTLRQTVNTSLGNYNKVALGMVIIAAFITLAVSYSAIIVRLHRNRKKVTFNMATDPSLAQKVGGVSTGATNRIVPQAHNDRLVKQ